MLKMIRESLLSEAIQSPILLADLAGLETYVAESYNARSFIELLQNADDAKANRFWAEQTDGALIVANDGAVFTDADFDSLCRSSASSKSRGDSIGYRGIGFKSVVGVASRVHIISGNLKTTFCRRMTQELVPTATRVPLVRIPHELDLNSSDQVSSRVEILQQDSFSTIFVFEELMGHAVDTEFESFDAASLLFLKNVRAAELIGKRSQRVVVSVVNEDPRTRTIHMDSQDGKRDWQIHDGGDIAIAVEHREGKAVRLSRNESVAHAFLPTAEETGFGVKVNGDFSTDPSRTRIVLDERSLKCIEVTAKLVLERLRHALDNNATEDVVPFVPLDDLRMSEFNKPSFKKFLAEEILKQGKNLFADYRLRPNWFNSHKDFELLGRKSGIKVLSCDLENVVGLPALLRSLGAVPVSVSAFSDALGTEMISTSGAIDIVCHLNDLKSTGQLDIEFDSWLVWPNEGKLVSTTQLAAKPMRIDSLPLFIERMGSETVLRKFLTDLIGEEKALIALPNSNESNSSADPISVGEPKKGEDFLTKKLTGSQLPNALQSLADRNIKGANVTKWRSAEVQVLEYLKAKGWTVSDVSLRNVGYDLEAMSSDGEEFYFEVKSISRIGEIISLTTNEEVVAREKGKNYILAIAHLTNDYLEIDFLPDPSNRLELVRQCKQWTWICERYPFDPERVAYVQDGKRADS